MGEFWIIRHGQSENNLNKKIESAKDAHLTKIGIIQAKFISKYVNNQPDLIVTSTYKRAKETASFLSNKFPDVFVTEWPLEEFTYLDKSAYCNSSYVHRIFGAINYWIRFNPDYRSSHNAENFFQLLERIKNIQENTINGKREFIIAFSHGWFTRAFIWYTLFYQLETDKQLINLAKLEDEKTINQFCAKIIKLMIRKRVQNPMILYLIFCIAFNLPNGSIVKFKIDTNKSIYYSKLEIEHISPKLITSVGIIK